MCVYTHTPTPTHTYTYTYIYIWLTVSLETRANTTLFNYWQSLFEVFSYNGRRFTGGACCFGYVDGWSKTLPHLFFWWNFKPRTFIYPCCSCTHVLIIWHDWWICFCLSIFFYFTPFPFWGQFLVSWRSRFKCWGSRSPHVWSVGPGEPSNLRHTCAGRSGRVMQSRWTVSLLATGHAPRPNNAKLTALQSCVQVCSAGMFSGPPLQGHWHTHSSNLYMTAYGKTFGIGIFPVSFRGLKKVSCVERWNVLMVSSTFLLWNASSSRAPLIIFCCICTRVVLSLIPHQSIPAARAKPMVCRLKTLVPRWVQASWWPESNIPVQQRKCASLSRGRCRRKLQG